jgi:uncharacterized membrane protein
MARRHPGSDSRAQGSRRSWWPAGLTGVDLALAVALVVGLVALVETAGPVAHWGRPTWGAILAGFGGFNLFDGVVDHKLLRVHQIRPGVADQLPYDVVWIGLSLLILAVGVGLARGDAPAGRGTDLPA